MNKLFSIPLAASLAAGCGPTPEMAALTPQHPASVDAAASAMPEPSNTLNIANQSAMPATEPPAGAIGMGGMNMGGMHDMKGMGMNASAATAPAIQYTCVMHPEVISDKPGKCPKCGMALVKKGSN